MGLRTFSLTSFEAQNARALPPPQPSLHPPALPRTQSERREVSRWAAMQAEAAAHAARTLALQASGAKARRNRSGASYHLLTMAPLTEADARAAQAREEAARARASARKAALAAHTNACVDIITGELRGTESPR